MLCTACILILRTAYLLLEFLSAGSLFRTVSTQIPVAEKENNKVQKGCDDHDPAAMKQAGIAYATDQIIDLIANGVRNIHVYSMNKPEVAAAIMQNLSEIVK